MSAWQLEQVPPSRWAEFTTLPRHDWIEMWTRSDFLTGDECAVDAWIEAQEYPVQLHCSDCQATAIYVADQDEDAAPGDEMWATAGLDERMAEFERAHRACPMQARMFR